MKSFFYKGEKLSNEFDKRNINHVVIKNFLSLAASNFGYNHIDDLLLMIYNTRGGALSASVPLTSDSIEHPVCFNVHFIRAHNTERRKSRMTRRGQEEEVGKQETTVPDGGQITCRNLFNRSAFSGSGLSYDASKITHKPGTFYSTIANLDTPYK
uniref:Uncharacterized protein n=1 Tax=Glossina palpalis gambiensis TaxID=67801 RepID=A0A1B0BCM2_9MUSC